MLRYITKTRPGLVALYDIRPGNGACLFLQPRSPHGASPPKVLQRTVGDSWCAISFYKPDALPVIQPTVSRAEGISHTC